MFGFIAMTETEYELAIHICRKIKEGEFEPEFIDEFTEFTKIYTQNYA